MKRNQSILHLILRRDPFDRIVAGTKKEEYRYYTPYYHARLKDRDYDIVHFRNGYAEKAPEIWLKFGGIRVRGRGASAYYAIRLGKIIRKVRCPNHSRLTPGVS